MAKQIEPIPKEKLQRLVNLVLEGITDDELQKLQSQDDRLAALAVEKTHHHDHDSKLVE